MNIRHRLQQLDKGNIQKICSRMNIRYSRDQNKSQLITTLLLPLQTYKMQRTRGNTGSKGTTTVVKPQEYYKEQIMEDLVKRFNKLNTYEKSTDEKPYIPTREQQERILKLLKDEKDEKNKM